MCVSGPNIRRVNINGRFCSASLYDYLLQCIEYITDRPAKSTNVNESALFSILQMCSKIKSFITLCSFHHNFKESPVGKLLNHVSNISQVACECAQLSGHPLGAPVCSPAVFGTSFHTRTVVHKYVYCIAINNACTQPPSAHEPCVAGRKTNGSDVHTQRTPHSDGVWVVVSDFTLGVACAYAGCTRPVPCCKQHNAHTHVPIVSLVCALCICIITSMCYAVCASPLKCERIDQHSRVDIIMYRLCAGPRVFG